ncbi:MAG: ethanolamine ammonia-lyase subunit EutC [Methylophilaceae bacterium]
MKRELVSQDAWGHLKQYTQARISLGRAGSSLPTQEILNFGAAHALARDAVHTHFESAQLAQSLETAGFTTLQVQSRAPDRHTYLLRPDMGRSLSEPSANQLIDHPEKEFDLLLVVGDGLSSLAVHNHSQVLLESVRSIVPNTWRLSPVVLASQARVAISDEIGAALKAKVVAMLVGERPGLSSPDSLGVYITYAPKPGRHDGERNCISNIRPEGLSYRDAAKKIVWLVNEAMRLGLSGVGLKDESEMVNVAATLVTALPKP